MPKKENNIILDVPYVEGRFKYSCSETATEMILKYYSINNIDQFGIHELGGESFEGKSSKSDKGIEYIFKYYKLKVRKGNTNTITRIRTLIRKNIPVIVRVITEENNLHTILIIGFQRKYLIYNDGDVGKNLYITSEEFTRTWTGKYMFIYQDKEK